MSLKSKIRTDAKTKKIFRVCFIPMVLLTVLACVIFSWMIINTINSAVNSQVASTTLKVCDDINTVLIQDITVMNDISSMSPENLKEKAVTDMLYTVEKNLKISESVYVVTTDFPHGGFFANNSGWVPDSSYDQNTREWYSSALKKNGELNYSVPYIDVITNKAVVSLARTLKNKQGKAVAVVGMDMLIDKLVKIFESLSISKSSKIFLLTEEGFYLTHKDESKVLKANYFKESKIGKSAKEWLDGGNHSFIKAGVTYYGVAKVDCAPWFIVTEGNMSDFGGAFIAALIVVIIILLVASFLLSVYVVKFVLSFQSKEKSLGEKLYTETQNLAVTAKETAATSQDQSAAVKEILATMEDSNTLSENISLKIMDVAKVAKKTLDDVKNGAVSLKSNVDKLHEIAESNNSTIKGIKFLGDKIENIWDIVSLINSVADQAKIIAFNAEIEAASAGEAGKNFHIVATEIRRLADGIIEGTREIKGKITEIQQSSDSLIIASESGTEKINEGCASANELEERFTSISNAAEITVDSTSNITSIIQQQAAASEQILITLKQIAAGVENFSSATENVSSAANELKNISMELNSQLATDTVN